ncbi:hypothetical protein T06_9191 [Trichinella sp. T6]|nr:hypothetical protein T06_9191 [Trichinella sp. T6]
MTEERHVNVGERSGWVFHFEEDRHDENRASTSIQLAHLTRKSSKHGSEDYGYDGEGADDGRERKPEENLPLMLLRYITLNITLTI